MMSPKRERIVKASDRIWMKEAIEEAKKGEDTSFPNPMVGAILANERCLARGYHLRPGLPHAERNALVNVDIVPHNATLYVTLEPCCSFGRTPPCVDIILEKNIRRVVVGMLDPDPRMRGRSIELLRNAGVEVVVGVCETECRNLNKRYIAIRDAQRPAITIKAACSLDGRTVSAYGKSKWITNQETRLESHHLRSMYDGILIGSGTLMSDNPSLNCRLPNGRNPVPIILDSHARCPSDAKVLHAGKKVILCCFPDAPERPDLPVERLEVPRDDKGMLDLQYLLRRLYDRGLYSILVEGGSRVIQSFICADTIDALELYMGNVFLGGGKTWGEGAPQILEQAPRLHLRCMKAIGSDVHISYFWRDFDV